LPGWQGVGAKIISYNFGGCQEIFNPDLDLGL
jgi:hypothetical protein